MTDGYSAEITNAAAFDAALAAIHRDLADLAAPLRAAAAQLASDAAAVAPRLTGRLAGSHRVLPAGPNRVRVTADTPYAAPIHWGWPGHDIRRQPWLVAEWMRSERSRDKLADGIQTDIDKAAAKT